MKLQIRPIMFGLVKIDVWIQPPIIFNPTVEKNPTLRISKAKEQQQQQESNERTKRNGHSPRGL
jgi:ribosomal protein S3